MATHPVRNMHGNHHDYSFRVWGTYGRAVVLDSSNRCFKDKNHIIYVFVVVHFDALAQASDFRIERRQVVFLC